MAATPTAVKPVAAWLTDYQIARTLFDASDADLILECTRTTLNAAAVPGKLAQGITFKVHRSRLTAESSFFEDMVAVAQPQTGDEGTIKDDSLPRISLDEHWLVVLLLLGHAYNRADILGQLPTAPNAHLLALFNAANKYFFHSAMLSSSCLLRLAVPSMNEQECLQVYVRACILGDEVLAKSVLNKAGKVPLQSLTTSHLNGLSMANLMGLIRTNASHIRSYTECIATAARKHDGANTVLANVNEIRKALGTA